MKTDEYGVIYYDDNKKQKQQLTMSPNPRNDPAYDYKLQLKATLTNKQMFDKAQKNEELMKSDSKEIISTLPELKHHPKIKPNVNEDLL